MKNNPLLGTRVLSSHVSHAQAKDFAMLVALALLVLNAWLQAKWPPVAAAAVLVLAMALPALFQPPSRLWLGAGRFLGEGVSCVFLLAVFYLLLTPLAWLVRRFGHDPLRLRQFKQGRGSVFTDNDHPCRPGDLENPY
jgi:hypothetical protein